MRFAKGTTCSEKRDGRRILTGVVHSDATSGVVALLSGLVEAGRTAPAARSKGAVLHPIDPAVWDAETDEPGVSKAYIREARAREARGQDDVV